MKKKFILNIFSPIITYGSILLLNIVVSRLILVGYGSETNGLLSSVNQIFGYLALLEAGIGTATITALYKPVADNDKQETGVVLAASRSYYRKSAVWYFICVVVASFVWPLVIETEIPYMTICFFILLQGASGVIAYCYTSTINNYLYASGKNYINNYVHIVVSVLTYAAKILICYLHTDIIFISVSAVGINLLKCVFYNLYIKKYYPEAFKQKKGDTKLLKQRNSFLIHEISSVIFSSTDTIIISIFCGLSEASIYAVYSMVFNAVTSLVGQVFNGTVYILGDSYAKDKDNYKHIHDGYNSIYICVVFIIFTVAFLLTLPFISLYTKGVTDADYLNPNLPILFVLIQLLSSCRVVANNLIKISLHAKQTINRTIIEAVINLVVSLALVQFIGIYGVLIGTIIALLYRTNDFILYANRKILKRSPLKEYKLYLANFIIFALFVIISRSYVIKACSYLQLIGVAFVVFVIVAIVYMIVNIVINYKDLKMLWFRYKIKK